MEETVMNEIQEALCPLRYVLEIIGWKWKLPILCILSDKTPKRYGEIKKKIPQITNMMLSQSLKELEAQNIITRIQYNEVPPHVEYILNDGLDELVHILEDLGKWGISHMLENNISFNCQNCRK